MMSTLEVNGYTHVTYTNDYTMHHDDAQIISEKVTRLDFTCP